MNAELIWRPVDFTGGKYWIREDGCLMSKFRESKFKKAYRDAIVKPASSKKKQYLKTNLHWRENGVVNKKGISIHRLVALAFVPPVEGKPHVNHKDGNKLNNHYSNLEWCTPQENNEHGVMMGLLKRGRNIKPYIKKGRNTQYKKVVNVSTREVFKSLLDVVAKEEYKKSYFGKQLRGDRINTTPYRYIDSDENFIRKPYKEKPKIPIAVFDVNWELITTFDYMIDAAEFAKTTSNAINYFLKGKCSQIKGYKFKRRATDGSFIEPIPFVPYARPPKKIKIKQPVTPSKQVVKYDENGAEIARFDSIGLAAKDVNTEKRQFRNAVRKSPRNFYKGFIYKFA